MIEMIYFEDCPINDRVYGGAARRKLGVVYEGQNYILKFPGNLKDKQLKNIKTSYSNAPVSEYIGSHAYELIGMPVHETKLGVYKNRVVVGCKDFLLEGENLIEFEKIKVTFLPPFLDSNGEETNGTGTDLQEVLMTIQEHPMLNRISGIEEHFWNMFVVDAFIGNPDRNNANWGIIKKADGSFSITPVYDNGNCLNNRWDDETMKKVLIDPGIMENESYKRKTNIFMIKEHHVKPCEYIYTKRNEKCNEAVKRLVPKIDMEKIKSMIYEIPCISDVRKKFYTSMISMRYEKVLLPTFQELVNMRSRGIDMMSL